MTRTIYSFFLFLSLAFSGNYALGQTQCHIFDLEVTAGTCANGQFMATLNFQHENVGNHGFKVFGNGVYYGTFNYDDLPISLGPLAGNGSTNYEFVVKDVAHPDCQDDFVLGPVSCPGGACDIYDLTATVGDCDDGHFYVTLDFEYQNVGSQGFKVFGNGVVYGTFNYDDLPVVIGPLAGNGTTNYEFLAKDVQFPDCHDAVGIGQVSCPGAGACDIYDLTAIAGDCDNGHFMVTIDFQYANVGLQGFKIQGNGSVFGPFEYDDLPVTIGPFSGNGTTNYEFLVKDVAMPDCKDVVELGTVNCGGSGGDCHIFNVVAEAHDCENGQFLLDIDFDFENVGNEGFTILGNGVNYGNFNYNQPFWTIGPLQGNGSIYDFVIKDLQKPNCKAFTHIGPVYCNGSCHIYDLVAEVSECDTEGQFYVTLEFEHSNTGSQGFKVHGNGNVYGFFDYGDLPVTLGPFESGPNVLEFAVSDVQHPSCKVFVLVETPDCDGGVGDCDIFDLTADVHPCLSNGSFYVSLNFEHEHTSGYFKVKGNGIIYGVFSYDDLPVSIGPLAGNGTTSYGFIVQDVHHPDCAEDVFVGTVECTNAGDCNIFDLIADPGECHNDGTYNLWLNFHFENVNNNYFDVFYNGANIGVFPLAHLPVVLHHFEDDGEPMQSITVCINDNPNCCATVEFESPGCQSANEVWPGDANADNITNHFDLLNLGLAFGAEGPHRTVQGIGWLGLDAVNWAQSFANNLNFKHADTDGNGKVNTADAEALQINFGKTHGEPLTYAYYGGTENDPAFYVDLPAASAMIPGIPFYAPIMLGTENKPVQNTYGIAFTLKFDPQVIKPGSVSIQYDPSWMGVMEVDLLTFDRSMGNEGIIKVALVRTDGNNVSGFGQIAGFISIIDNIAGKENVSIEIQDVRAIRENEMLIPLYRPVEVVELITGTYETAKEDSFLIYPNPAKEVIYFQHVKGLQVESVEVKDMNGRPVMANYATNNQISVDQLPAGVYTLKIKSDDRFFFEKFIKL